MSETDWQFHQIKVSTLLFRFFMKHHPAHRFPFLPLAPTIVDGSSWLTPRQLDAPVLSGVGSARQNRLTSNSEIPELQAGIWCEGSLSLITEGITFSADMPLTKTTLSEEQNCRLKTHRIIQDVTVGFWHPCNLETKTHCWLANRESKNISFPWVVGTFLLLCLYQELTATKVM